LIVVDSNVLVYAVGRRHPLQEHCRLLVVAVRDGVVAATSTAYVIQEFVHVYARSRPRPDAARLGRRYATLFAPLLSTREDELRTAFNLFERYPGLDAADALLAATALANDAEALVSADVGFASVPRLRHVLPGTPEFERLLAA
jgi:predicted nucleic acid-binding protein